MPEHLRALVAILVLGCPMLWFVQRALCPGVMATADFVRRRNLWIGLTLAAFLSHNYWLFVAIAAVLIVWNANPAKENNPVATFLFLLFAVPLLKVKIPGMGIIEHLFELNHARLLAVLLLLPAAIRLSKGAEVPNLGKAAADWLLLMLLAIQTVRVFSETTLTQSLRDVFYMYVDILLIYYVCSRSLRDTTSLREALASACAGLLVVAPIAIFEFGRGWLPFASVDDALGVSGHGGGQYLTRGTSVRALGPAGHPLVLGFALAVAFGLWTGLRNCVAARYWWSGAVLLLGGLVATLSKGPWVGAAVMVLISVAAGPRAGPRLVKLSIGATLLLLAVFASPNSEGVIAYLPFVGTLDEGSVTYRSRLFEVSMMVFWISPIVGSSSFLSNPLLEEMRQGEGIIDMVNSYLIYALLYGSVGVTLFIGIFLASLSGLFSWMRRVAASSAEDSILGAALLATTIGIMVMIATVSSILSIPVLYWSLCGAGVAYAFAMKARARQSANSPMPRRAGPPPTRAVARKP